MEKQYDVFISYSSKDEKTADAMVRVLESLKLRCWIAHRDIPFGANWATEIDRAIHNSTVLVLLMSKESLASEQVEKEIGLADKACEKHYAVRIDDAEPQGSIRYHLSGIQITEAAKDTEKKMKTLAAQIRSDLRTGSRDGTTKKSIQRTKGKRTSSTGKAFSPKLASLAGGAVLLVGILIYTSPNFLRDSGIPINFTTIIPAAQTSQPSTEEQLQETQTEATDTITVDYGDSGPTTQFSESNAQPQHGKEQTEPKEPELFTGGNNPATGMRNFGEKTGPIVGPAAEDGSNPLFGAWHMIYSTQDENKEPHFPEYFTVCSDGYTFFSQPMEDAYDEAIESGVNGLTIASISKDCTDGIRYPYARLQAIYEEIKDGRQPQIVWGDGTVNFCDIYLLAEESQKVKSTTCCFLEGEFDKDSFVKEEGDTAKAEPIKVKPEEIDAKDPENNEKFLKRYLVIHVTWDYRESPSDTSPADTWLVYQREDRMLGMYLNLTLMGTWTDSKGSTWRFSPKENDLDIVFSITHEDDTIDVGDFFFYFDDEENGKEFEEILFRFLESSQYNKRDLRYTVVYYDGCLLYLLDEEGEPFYLVRN